VKVENR